ncbi:hypothetical protein KKB18_02710, partial [bacterium]|nr:hypothetical protein [bacterium]
DIKYFSHTWGDSNSFLVTVSAKDNNGVEAKSPSMNVITIYKNRAPYFAKSPAGPPNGQRNIAYAFTTTAIDPEVDNISYKFYWGDGEISDWSDFQKSGTEFIATHSYNNFAQFVVTAYAKDTKGLISDISIGHNVLISSNQLPHFNNMKPIGPTTGVVGVEYEFETSPLDPEKTPLSVKFIWGDGSESEWSQLQQSGSTFLNNHVYHEAGDYKIFCYAKDSDGIISLPSPYMLIKIFGPANQAPFFTEPPVGPDTTTVNTKEVFYTSAVDPEGDMIQYKFYWTNEVSTEWTEFVPSGDEIARSHAWTDVGTFDIKVFARDDKGDVSQSDAHPVTITAE